MLTNTCFFINLFVKNCFLCTEIFLNTTFTIYIKILFHLKQTPAFQLNLFRNKSKMKVDGYSLQTAIAISQTAIDLSQTAERSRLLSGKNQWSRFRSRVMFSTAVTSLARIVDRLQVSLKQTSLASIKKQSKADLLGPYSRFICGLRNCRSCDAVDTQFFLLFFMAPNYYYYYSILDIRHSVIIRHSVMTRRSVII